MTLVSVGSMSSNVSGDGTVAPNAPLRRDADEKPSPKPLHRAASDGVQMIRSARHSAAGLPMPKPPLPVWGAGGHGPAASVVPRSSLQLEGGSTVRVRVAARVRPLLPLEAIGPRSGPSGCIQIDQEDNCITAGRSRFAFDRVFGPGSSQEQVYNDYVEPLVEGAFSGFNGTLLAYGQTGSGKTYTMGTSGLPSVPEGALQRAIRGVFARVQAAAEGDAEVRVSYIEICTDSKGTGREEVRDLLSPGRRAPVLVSTRRDVDGQIKLEGVAEHEIWNEEEAFRLLSMGSAARATASTRLNDASSRSHAIFSLEVIQRRIVEGIPSTLTAKFQFVDLAGSEKVKVSGAEGEQLSQAININHGLFVLGKVITALTEGHPHVPFRESTLTRMLQNSLGGNSRTCMIACISPSEVNLAESISTLTYAARAKEIRNSLAVNLLSSCPNCANLQAKLLAVEGDGPREDDSNGCAVGSVAPRCTSAGANLHVSGGARSMRERALEKENVDLRKDIHRLQQELASCRDVTCDPPLLAVPAPSPPEHGAVGGQNGRGTPYFGRSVSNLSWPTQSGVGAGAESDGTGNDGEQAMRLKSAEELAARNEALYKMCSEKLAALQLQHAEDGFTDDDELSGDLFHDPDESQVSGRSEVGAFGACDDPDLDWLDKEAKRKERLLIQVEENHQAMAVLEAQTQERIEQHQAARDLAEKELARLQAELEDARTREEQLSSLRESYEDKVAHLQQRNKALEKDKAEMRRLSSMQKRQGTRLHVLQDSIRQVTQERDRLKNQLDGEVRRRKEQEANMKTERSAAQKKIRHLNTRLALLERSAPVANNKRAGSLDRGRTRSLLDVSRKSRLPGRSRSRGSSDGEAALRGHMPAVGAAPTSASNGTGAEPWQALLQSVAERALRERHLEQGEARLESMQAQVIAASAQRERLAMEAELDMSGKGKPARADIEALDADLNSLSIALEYQREQVWMLRRDLGACKNCGDVLEAAGKLAQNQDREKLADAVTWLCSEATSQAADAMAARDERETLHAEVATLHAALNECRQLTVEQEKAFDNARTEYETRVAYLLGRLNDRGKANEAAEAVGEEAITVMSRRIAELEDTLNKERQEGLNSNQRKLQQDIELITRYREQESLNKRLESQVKEAAAQIERTIARSARKEASLLQQVKELEGQVAAKGEPCSNCTEDDWGLREIQSVWRAAGLGEEVRQDLLHMLRTDIQKLCDQRLQQHSEWKQNLDNRIEAMRQQLHELVQVLGEDTDENELPKRTLLETVKYLESSIASLAEVKQHRLQEFLELECRAKTLHQNLYERCLDPPWGSAEEPSALHESALHRARERVKILEELESKRNAVVAEHANCLKDLWASLGLQVPDALDAQEVALLEGNLPPSEANISYLEARCTRLKAAQQELRQEEGKLRERLARWANMLAPFGVSVPNVSTDEALLPCINALKAAVADAELSAGSFVQEERASVRMFWESSKLQSLTQVLHDLDAAESLQEKIAVLALHWQTYRAQRDEHRRIIDMIAERDALEAEMRDFDAESSDPSRFRRRGYSGVEENKRRKDYQKRLRALDASLGSSIADWEEKERMPFFLGGVEYRGVEILSEERTHMYAWTGKQVAQKQVLHPADMTSSSVSDGRRASSPGCLSSLYPEDSEDAALPMSTPRRGRPSTLPTTLESGGSSSPPSARSGYRRSYSSGSAPSKYSALGLQPPTSARGGRKSMGSDGSLVTPQTASPTGVTVGSRGARQWLRLGGERL